MILQGEETHTFDREELLDLLVCPSCHGPMVAEQGEWKCLDENIRFSREGGIPSFILPERRAAVDSFLKGYHRIRTVEGWGSPNAEYYRCLPYRDISQKHGGIWRIRARSFDCFLDHLLRHVRPPCARILDIGAGNCWLSSRLAERGFELIALDINLDPLDGLGVLFTHFRQERSVVSPVRAEFDALPFAPAAFDVVVFNASLHYSPDILRTLEQAVILLRPNGILYILDSPIYHRAESGRMMLQEAGKKFQRLFGVPPNEEFAGNFLTFDLFNQLQRSYRVEYLKPRYGARWALRPLIATLLNRREPATFQVIAIHQTKGN